MFDIIPFGAKRYDIIQLSKTIGCKISDFGTLTLFIRAWVEAFHPTHMGWFNPLGPDTTTYYSKTEYPDYKKENT